VCAALLVAAAGAATAQPYPSKSLRLIVPFAPGGSADFVARLVGQKLAESFGQQVIVDNRGGGSGMIGNELVARSAPDGYTLTIGTLGPFAVNQSLFSKMPYDPVKDFTPITNLVNLPSVLLVHPSVPAKSVKELIALARKRPGELQYSSAGSGAQPHLTAEMFKTMAGVNLLHVPYKGAGPQMIGLLSGEVALTFATAPSGVPYVKNGQLRALGVTSANRIPALPEVPTIAEAGVPGYEAVGWNGMVAPAAMPAPILEKIHDAVVKVIQLPDLRERLTGLGAELSPSTPDEFSALIKSEIVKWAKVVKDSGARLD